MARCRECRAYNMKISGTSSRRLFVFHCVNPRCRITYVQTLGIAGDLVVVFKNARSKRLLSRKSLNTSGHLSPMDDSD
jgi:hypothetical protein